MRLKGNNAVEYRFTLIIPLYKEGKKQQQIATLLGCSQAWVSKILQRYKVQGKRGLKVKVRARGKKPLLCAAQVRRLKTLLLKGALRQGLLPITGPGSVLSASLKSTSGYPIVLPIFPG